MLSIVKHTLLIVLLLYVVPSPIVAVGQVKSLLSDLVANLTGDVTSTIVCVQDGAADALKDLLNGVTASSLGDTVITAIAPLLTNIDTSLVNILALVNTLLAAAT
ncbi:uncharacterized protein LOC132786755 [Drosophila nasuta]|uniref:uncharacterized protein LOC132786755 n=1 Tax=Drosophila nasuta TaxID=42062 RepID=UPI00295E594B|nr:uncharacterized protein LOC132786755 [Drosophila nasuta]